MSSVYVRTTVTAFLNANSDEDFLDLTGQYDLVSDFIKAAGLGTFDPWVGLDWIGNEEEPITIGSTNSVGMYRETGGIYIHVIDKARLGIGTALLTRAEALRDLLRGRRIGDIIVDSVTPANTGAGAAFQFEGGYTAASFLVSYYRDINL